VGMGIPMGDSHVYGMGMGTVMNPPQYLICERQGSSTVVQILLSTDQKRAHMSVSENLW